jgi:chloride channel protein, CIC family
MQKKTILSKFLIWVISNIGHRQLLLSLSLIIGLVSGLAAVVLKNTVYFTSAFLSGRLALETNNLIYLAFPLFGIFLSVLFVRKFIKDNISHGVSKVLHAISRKDSKLASHNSYSSMVASTFTVGFGGSVGLEAPIVLTGASIGSNLGSLMKLDYKTITLLIACGATGAIAGIFKSPIAAMIFSLEVLMLDLTMWSIIPLLISAVTGATVATLLLGQGAVFYFTLHEPFLIENIPWYILLGIIAGLVSFYFTWCSMKVESRMQNISSPYHRLFYGGAILGLLIFIFPPLYGEGYGTLRSLLGGDASEIAAGSLISGLRNNYWIFLGFLSLILVFKVIAMAITTGSGGVGGIFAPSLYMGGVTGFIVARLINYFPFINVSERNFALVGMAGLMAGVMHAPLTAIFLIAEITGGYELFIPLIITSTFAYLTIMYFEPHSIYTKRLAARGELITHHKDKAVLTLMRMGPVIENDLRTVHPEDTLGQLVKIVSASKRNIFPVVDRENNLMGIVLLDNIRDIIFKPAQYDKIRVRDIMIIPNATVSSDENMESVMQKFEDSGAWNLPVLDDKKYVGFISKSKIFSAYRKILVQFSSE